MHRMTIRRSFLPVLVLLGLAAAFILAAPAVAAADSADVGVTVAQTRREPGPFFGENVVVPQDETYTGVVAFGGDVDVLGTVDGPVVAFGGDVHVSGTVTEEIVAFGGDIVLETTARAGTSLNAGEDGIIIFGGAVTQEPGSEFAGTVRRFSGGDFGSAIGWAAGTGVTTPLRQFFSFGSWLFTTLVFLVLGLVAAALLPNQMRGLQRQLAARPAASLGWGALTFFVIVPITIIALVISIVGLLVVIPGIPTLLLAYFFAVVGVGALIAERFVAGRVSERNQLFLATAIGVVATSIVSAVPVFGGFLIMVMMVFGTGAAILAVGDWRRRRKPAVAGQLPPEAPQSAAPPAQPAQIQSAPPTAAAGLNAGGVVDGPREGQTASSGALGGDGTTRDGADEESALPPS